MQTKSKVWKINKSRKDSFNRKWLHSQLILAQECLVQTLSWHQPPSHKYINQLIMMLYPLPHNLISNFSYYYTYYKMKNIEWDNQECLTMKVISMRDLIYTIQSALSNLILNLNFPCTHHFVMEIQRKIYSLEMSLRKVAPNQQ
jgi:hypothetical protein